MTVMIDEVAFAGLATEEWRLGDLGDAAIDELVNKMAVMKGRSAAALAQFVDLLESAGIMEKLATTGSDAVKSLVGKLRDSANKLRGYGESAPPDWLYWQAKQQIVDVATAAVNAGMNVTTFVNESQNIVNASAYTAAPAVTTPAKSAVPTPGASFYKTSKVPVETPAVAPTYQTTTTTYTEPARGPAAGGGGFVGFLKDYWLPLTIVGVGVGAAVLLTLMEKRPAPAAAGLGRCGRRSRRRR